MLWHETTRFLPRAARFAFWGVVGVFFWFFIRKVAPRD